MKYSGVAKQDKVIGKAGGQQQAQASHSNYRALPRFRASQWGGQRWERRDMNYVISRGLSIPSCRPLHFGSLSTISLAPQVLLKRGIEHMPSKVTETTSLGFRV